MTRWTRRTLAITTAGAALGLLTMAAGVTQAPAQPHQLPVLSPELAGLVEEAGRGLSPAAQEELWQLAAEHGDPEGWQPGDAGGLPWWLEDFLRRQVAGTYFSEIEVDSAPGVTILSYINFHADGTGATDNNAAQGSLDPDLNAATLRGSYRFTGLRSTKNVWLYHVFDADGLPQGVARVDVAEDWANDFSSGSGSLTIRLYLPDEDPLDPDGGVVVDAGTFFERRLEVPLP